MCVCVCVFRESRVPRVPGLVPPPGTPDLRRKKQKQENIATCAKIECLTLKTHVGNGARVR